MTANAKARIEITKVSPLDNSLILFGKNSSTKPAIKGKKVVLTKPNECNLCGACVDACNKDAIKLDFDSSSFIFTIEPTAGLTKKEIVELATKELLGKSKQFAKELKKAK